MATRCQTVPRSSFWLQDPIGTQSFFVRGNLRTRNRDPVTLGYSSILAKVPITRSHNGVEKYQGSYSFSIQGSSKGEEHPGDPVYVSMAPDGSARLKCHAKECNGVKHVLPRKPQPFAFTAYLVPFFWNGV